MGRAATAMLFAVLVLLGAPAVARAADEPAAAPPAPSPAKYKIVVEQYAKGELIGSAEFTVADTPSMCGVTL